MKHTGGSVVTANLSIGSLEHILVEYDRERDYARFKGNLEALAAEGVTVAARMLDATADEDACRTVAVETTIVSDAPKIVLHHNALTPMECAYMRELATPYLTTSRVAGAAEGIHNPTVRDSRTASLPEARLGPFGSSLVSSIRRIAGFAPASPFPINVNRYPVGGFFKAHHDSLDESQRQHHDIPLVRTAILFLNDDYNGGETAFPKARLAVKGRTGDLLVFTNLSDDLSIDPLAEHAGMVVRDGEKWVAVQWDTVGTS